MNEKFEAHDYSSLSRRLRCMISRTTLRSWVRDSVIRPARTITGGKSKHLIFSAGKLDQLLELLEEAYRERLGRVAKNERELRQHRAAATANALRVLEQNEKRDRLGLPILPEPNPALDEADAVGRVSLVNHEKHHRIQTNGGIK